jgi:coenzyme F420 hydrogenase subunit beta
VSPDVEKSLERARRWLKENTKRLAFKRLERDIITTGVCTECGACVSNCPINVLEGVRDTGKYIPTLVGKCVACGICYVICPRTIVLWSDLVGEFRSVWKVRSLIEGAKKQDGGAATSFIAHALNEGIVDGAIVVDHDSKKPWLPVPKLLKDGDKVSKHGGTFYTHAPVVQKMMDGFREGLSSIAVTGTSCNLDAVSNMQTYPAGFFRMDFDASVLKIGLFCMESFDYEGLVGFLKDNGIAIKDVQRVAIAGGKFTATTKDGDTEWPIAELNHIAAKSCSYCHDLTSKNADISCGNIGSDDGWTTVLVRTARGEHIFQETLAAGLIEAELLDEKSLRTVQNVARSKAMKYLKLDPHH